MLRVIQEKRSACDTAIRSEGDTSAQGDLAGRLPIIKGGDWMKTLSAILEAEGGFSSQQEIEVAQRIIAELVPLMEDLSDQENAFAAWSLSDFE